MKNGDLAKIVFSIVLSSILTATGSVFAMKVEIAVIKNDISYIQKDLRRLGK